MYVDYYGFSEKPFTATPNPRFIFFSSIHKEAFALLLYGVTTRFGFIELVGEVGTGKTTVLRTLLSQLDEARYRTALIFNPPLSAVDLMRAVNREFGIPAASGNVAELLAELERFLLGEHAAGRIAVLVIDEAQNLAPEVLEQIRLVSNLETETDKLIQIVLAGQPELARLLERAELRQINQRIALRYRLRPLSRGESRRYIEHRLAVAGGRDTALFTAAAYWWLHRLSRGTPRLINMLCDRALLIGYAEGKRRITGRLVTWAFKDIMLKPALGAASVLRGGVLALALGALVFLGTPLVTDRKPAGSAPHTTAPAQGGGDRVTPAPAAPTALKTPADVRQAVRDEVALLSETKTGLQAFNALAAIWRAPALDRLNGKPSTLRELKRQAAKRGLELTPFSGGVNEFVRLDSPALLPLAEKPAQAGIYVAFTGRRNGRYVVVPRLLGQGTFSSSEFAAIWPGRAYLVWRNAARIPLRLPRGTRGEPVRKLQALLQTAGCRSVAATGTYDEATVKGLREFQRTHGLTETGTLGATTLIRLYQAAKHATVQKPADRQKAGAS